MPGESLPRSYWLSFSNCIYLLFSTIYFYQNRGPSCPLPFLPSIIFSHYLSSSYDKSAFSLPLQISHELVSIGKGRKQHRAERVHLQVSMEMPLLISRDGCCIHPFLYSMFIFLVQFTCISSHISVTLCISCHISERILWGLAYFTKSKGLLTINDEEKGFHAATCGLGVQKGLELCDLCGEKLPF